MGIYLNPGNRGFWQAVRSKIYVDKSGLISYTNQLINTEEQYLCVSRPKRFGKSTALEGHGGEILLVGINYNRNDKEKPHTCVTEKQMAAKEIPIK